LFEKICIFVVSKQSHKNIFQYIMIAASAHFQAFGRLTQQANLFFKVNQQNVDNHIFMDIQSDDVLQLLQSLNKDLADAEALEEIIKRLK
jgi:hypothetical protein